MSFSINCLEITAPKEVVEKNGNIYKNLLTTKEFDGSNFKFPKRIFFNDFYKREPDENGNLIPNEVGKRLNSDLFFGKNINIQAIVGMNGCGKSSLLDLMYMAINNFCFMFERGRILPNTTFLFYVNNLYVNLYYSIENREYVLHCEGEKIYLEIPHSDGVNRLYSTSEIYTSIKTEFEIKEIVAPFFYTIVSNYSLQSFISSNYSQNISVFNRTKNTGDKPSNVRTKDGYQKKEPSDKCFDNNTSWIDSIFHKNDGYVRSIVLNPFRDKGVVDMNREQQISKYRLISLLIKDSESERNKRIFQDYSINKIEYELNEDFVASKYPNCKSAGDIKEYLYGLKTSDDKQLKGLFDIYFLIFTHYCPSGADSSFCVECAIYYLAYKIDKIINSYKPYEIYQRHNDFSIYEDNADNAFDSLLHQILNDKSHVTSKIKQTMHFLEKCKTYQDYLGNLNESQKGEKEKEDEILCWDEYGDFDSKFDYDTYISFTGRTKNPTLDKIIEELPPPIFRYTISLKNEKNGDYVDLNQLSSGEMQMMHTLATHAYHIRNLLSINDENRVKYQNINLVFDEVEIRFHPEYQRLFIDRLVKMLTALQKNDCHFNVFVVTHSPFVLSDIPNQNVLYLQDGKQLKNNIESYAQNISTILRNGFFLKSFMGENAKNLLNNLIDKIESKGIRKELYQEIITQIGDKFLKDEIEQYSKI